MPFNKCCIALEFFGKTGLPHFYTDFFDFVEIYGEVQISSTNLADKDDDSYNRQGRWSFSTFT